MSENIPGSADEPIQSDPVDQTPESPPPREAGELSGHGSPPREEGEFSGHGRPPREEGEFGGRGGSFREEGDFGGRGGPPRDGPGGRRRPYYRRKVDRTKNLEITYRKPEVLERFITQSGKILPRRVTGTSAKNQRKLARQIKIARVLAMLPYKRQGKPGEGSRHGRAGEGGEGPRRGRPGEDA